MDRTPVAQGRLLPVNRRSRDGRVLARPGHRPPACRAGAPTRQRPAPRACQPGGDRGLSLSALVDGLAPAAYPLAGLSLALVYPMGLIWFTNLNPGDGDGLVILILMMMAGGVIGPALTGVAVSLAGVRAVPVCIAVLAAADFVVFFIARQFHAPPGPSPATAERATLSRPRGPGRLAEISAGNSHDYEDLRHPPVLRE